MKVDKIETRIVNKTEYYCDICEKCLTDRYQYKCAVCGKDICIDCRQCFEHEKQDMRGSQTKKVICLNCFKVGTSFIKNIQDEVIRYNAEYLNNWNEHQTIYKQIIEDWHKTSLSINTLSSVSEEIINMVQHDEKD